MLCTCGSDYTKSVAANGLANNESLKQELARAELEVFIDQIVEQQMLEHNIANLTLSVVHQAKIILSKGYGYADFQQRTAVDPNSTLFRIGSTSKLFTWTAIMQLVEQGLIDLDADINEYLDFTIPNYLEVPSKQETEAITIRHLMTHTPGFEDYMTKVFSISEASLVPLAEHVREQRPLRVFAPGEVIAYSNYGTNLAGYIVQQVSGMEYAEYVEKNIYKKLDMNNSTFRQPLPTNLAGDLANGYRYVDGEFKQAEFEFFTEPAGSMSSTSTDMAKFMLAFLADTVPAEQQLLRPATIERIFTEYQQDNQYIEGMAYGFIKNTINARDVFHHPGGTMLFNTACYLLPDEQFGFFVSHSGGSFLINMNIFHEIMDKYFPEADSADNEVRTNGYNLPVETATTITKSSSSELKKLAGEYYPNRRSFSTEDALLSLMGRVIVQSTDNGDLLVQNAGEQYLFKEIAPSVFVNTYTGHSKDFAGGFQKIVFSTDTLGKNMLKAGGPMSYSQASWYETMGFTLVTILLSLLIIVGSFVYWMLKAAYRGIIIKKQYLHNQYRTDEKLFKVMAMGLGAMVLLFFGLTVTNGAINPIYGLPDAAFIEPGNMSKMIDLVLYYTIAVLVIGVVLGALYSWIKAMWSLLNRIHYSLYALASLMLLWHFWFWNVL